MSSSRIAISLYRIISKEIRAITAAGDGRLFLNRKIDPLRWGSGGFIELPSQLEILSKVVPPSVSSMIQQWTRDDMENILRNKVSQRQGLDAPAEASAPEFRPRLPLTEEVVDGFTRGQMQHILKQIFLHRKSATDKDMVTKFEDDGFAALRTLSDQLKQLQRSSVCCTRGLSVRVLSTYMANDSKARGTHVYCYRITLHNQGQDTVRLIGREWKILDAHGNLASSVPRNSPGVIGQHPELRPGDAFEYHSGTDLCTREGKMNGSFQMKVTESPLEGRAGLEFDAVVSPFALLPL